jgi:hypothetical protein
MRISIYCLAALFTLSACSTAMKTEDVRQMHSNCSNVSSQISMLETEKKNNDKRLRAGVTSIFPISAVANLLNESYGTNVEVATGEWAAAIDLKLGELYTLQANCRKK